MTALERLMAADAVALSKEHADRADAAEARAVAAEAKLAEITARCKDEIDRYMADDPGGIGARFPDDVQVSAVSVLAIIGTVEGGDAGDDWSFTDPAL